MKITLNGLSNPSNIITFTNCPTILTVSDAWTGTAPSATITVKTLSGVTNADDYYIEVDGYKIQGTSDLTKSVGNRFYITSSNTTENKVFVAKKICDALRSIGQLSVNYNIYQSVENGALSPSVVIKGRSVGQNRPTVRSNTNNKITSSSSAGSITSTFNGSTTNKVVVDIYRVTPPNRINSTSSRGQYIATLEKNVWGGDTSFDLSTIFNSYCDYGEISQFQINVMAEVDNRMTILAQLTNIYATKGYLVNQGGSFIPKFSGAILAQNVKRGQSTGQLNNSTLYVYEPTITFSLFADHRITSLGLTINYLNGAWGKVATSSQTIFCGNNLSTFVVNLNQQYMNQSAYVDVVIPNLGTLRYNIIKPIHATEDCQRIYWTNSYGGTSFFDFTGMRTEERKTDIVSYEKSLYDYYTAKRREHTEIYSKDIEITVTLTTHNIGKDGTWQLFDLQNSMNAWTVVNGNEYAVHISDIKIDESEVSGIYTGQIEYTYSMGDTF